MERTKRTFNKTAFKNEQYYYRSHYKHWLLGYFYNHPEFMVGRYFYHLRKAERYDARHGILAKLLYHWHTIRKFHYSYKTGLQIGLHSCDYGVMVYHYGHIVVNGGARIGKNLSIYPGVTIGQVQGDFKKTPIIGNNVWIFANAMVQGEITIGDNAIIAPNSVVTHSVPANAIVAGVPAKVIGYKKYN